MKIEKIRELFRSYVDEDASSDDFAKVSVSETPLREAIDVYLKETPYPEPEFYDHASNFFHSQGEYSRAEEMLERWRKAKGNPITPIIRHALLYFADDYITYQECLTHIAEGLKQEPENSFLLSIGYQAAVEEKDGARRLYYAGRLAEISAEADQQIAYGVECGKNLMIERAQAAFAKALALDADDVRGLNGLAKCRLEKLDLHEGEELLRQSLHIKETPFAKKALEMVTRLRSGKLWSDEETRLEKFWIEWTDSQLAEIKAEEQTRLLAECFSSAQTRK